MKRIKNVYSISDLKEHASNLGGKCLSDTYVNRIHKYSWQCAKGHKWPANWNNVKNHGQWCPQCAGPRYSIADLNRKAREHGGKCLSEEYKHSESHYTWQCQNKHEWEDSWYNINRLERWCPECKRPIYKHEDLVEHAKQMDGKFLSEDYIGPHEKYIWQCHDGHEWEATWYQIQKKESWCPQCVRPKYSISDLINYANENSGQCLSKYYINNKTKYKWKCCESHIWEASWSALKNNSSWCPTCARLRNTEKLRKWDEISVRNAAQNYSTRGEFYKSKLGAYKAAKRLGIFEELFADKPNGGFANQPPKKLTKEFCIQTAKNVQNRTELQNKYNRVYNQARKQGWLDEICIHMDEMGNLLKRKIYAIVSEEKKMAYVGLSFDPEKRYQEHKKRGTPAVRELLSHNHELKILSELLDSEKATEEEKATLEAYKKRGYNLANAMATGGLGAQPFQWDFDNVMSAAKSVATRGELQKKHPGAYQASLRNGWIDDVFSEHVNQGFSQVRGPRQKWTKSECLKVSHDCNSRSEFKRKYPSAYRAAIKYGWISEFFLST